MQLPEFEARIREGLNLARDSLARIEQEVRETGEKPDLMMVSRTYAEFCLYAREYLTSVQVRRPAPRRWARQVRALRERLSPYEDTISSSGLRPTAAELDALLAEAESLPGTF